jgi:leucyl-tRNA synthetase
LDDANFAIDTANAAVLKLTTEEEFIKSTLKLRSEGGLRHESTDNTSFMDAAFTNELNKSVVLTKTFFSKMMFREGLRTAWFEMQIARDQYRDWSEKVEIPMREDLIMRYIEWEAIMMAPICPHWSEHVWQLLGKPGLVIDAMWPEADPVDKGVDRAYRFLLENIKLFRQGLIKAGKDEEKGYIYVNDEYPAWQTGVLGILAEIFDAHQALPPDALTVLKERILSDASLKPHMKDVSSGPVLLEACEGPLLTLSMHVWCRQAMKVAAFVRDEVSERGRDALEVTLAFDQKEVLRANLEYIAKSLGLREILIFDVKETAPGPDAKKALAMPNRPGFHAYR